MEPHQQITSRVELRPLTEENRPTLENQLQALLTTWSGVFDTLPAQARIFLKPNLIPDRHNQPLTSPAFLEVLTSLLIERKYHVTIGDSPALLPQDNRALYQAAGLDALTRKGVRVISFEEEKLTPVPVGTRTYYLPADVVAADLVINLPTLERADNRMSVGALFSLYGLLPGFQKMSLYQQAPFAELFAGVVVDIASLIAPVLTIMRLSQPDGRTVIASSTDLVALDAMMASLAGLGPEHIPVIRQAADAGLGIAFSEAVSIDNRLPHNALPVIERAPVRPLLHTLRPFFMNLTAPFVSAAPAVDSERCDGCADCIGACPTGALTMTPGQTVPDLRSARCVGCFACTAQCQRDAILITQSGLFKRLPQRWRRFCAQ